MKKTKNELGYEKFMKRIHAGYEYIGTIVCPCQNCQNVIKIYKHTGKGKRNLLMAEHTGAVNGKAKTSRRLTMVEGE